MNKNANIYFLDKLNHEVHMRLVLLNFIIRFF